MAKKYNKYRKKNDSSGSLQKEAYSAKITDDLIFETESSVDAEEIENLLLLLYGRNKIGKSTFASLLDGVYFLPAEPGYKFLDVRKTRIYSWKAFIKFIKAAPKKSKWLKTVKMFAIDGIDGLAKMCQLYVCGRDGIVHPSDHDWGKGWDAYTNEFAYWILRLIDLDKGVIFIGHEQLREVVSRSTKVDKTMPAMPKNCFTILNNLCDQIFCMGFDEKKNKKAKSTDKLFTESRCLFTKPSEKLEAGGRFGNLPRKIMFNTEQELLDKLRKHLKSL